MRLDSRLLKNLLYAVNSLSRDIVLKFKEDGIHTIVVDERMTRFVHVKIPRYALRDYGYKERAAVVNVLRLHSILSDIDGVMDLYVIDGSVHIITDSEAYIHHVQSECCTLEPATPVSDDAYKEGGVIVEADARPLRRMMRVMFKWPSVKLWVEDGRFGVTGRDVDDDDCAHMYMKDGEVYNADKLNGVSVSTYIDSDFFYNGLDMFRYADTIKIGIGQDMPVSFWADMPNGTSVHYVVAPIILNRGEQD